jgi:hypothetical protein
MCPHVVSGAGRWQEGKVEGGWLAAHLLRTGGMACMCMCRSPAQGCHACAGQLAIPVPSGRRDKYSA